MSLLSPDDEQCEDADASGVPAAATITRLIITVEEPGSSPPIYTVSDGWLVSDGAGIAPIELGKLGATREVPVDTRDGSQHSS